MIGAANFDSLTLKLSNPDAFLLEKEQNWTNTKDGVIYSISKFTLTFIINVAPTLVPIELRYRQVYHIVTGHAFQVESIVTYHRISRKESVSHSEG